jgi:peptidoglycan-associated lipoprotein
MKKIFLPAIISSIILLSGCADYHLRQGNRLFSQYAYSEAIPEYEKALSKKPSFAAEVGIAESHRLMNNTVKAEEGYAKVVESTEVQPIHKFRYAQLLMINGKHAAAKPWLEAYLKDNPKDEAAEDLLISCDKVDDLKKDSLRYTVELSKLNTGESNFSPVIYKDGIVFATDRKGTVKKSKGINLISDVYSWTGRPFLDMYFSKPDKTGGWSTPEALKGDVNGLYHDGPAAFSGDTIMYFTRNNYTGKKTKTGSDEVVNLKIYESRYRNNTWTQVQEFPFNSDNYSTGHPTLTKDGNTMYFVSDMPGGMGGTDLWMTQKVDGKWGQPVNMGAKFNTAYNEMFPSLFADTLLYFSSQGHTNLGGLDIFTSVKRNGEWTDPENIGYPINTSYDDFGVSMTDSAVGGLFSSNRGSNSMLDNIYTFKLNDLHFTLNGLVVEKPTQLPLSDVSIELINKATGEKVNNAVTLMDGKFVFTLDRNTDYTVVAKKHGYYNKSEDVSTVGRKVSEDMNMTLKLEMEKIKILQPIAIENIYYDYDKWDIRADATAGLDKLVAFMKEYPDILIELSSHTDSRGRDEYNQKLSEKRAQSAVDYIIAQGIDKDRIVARGYGESRLINSCGNKSKCSETEHQQNRRTEFKVTGFRKTDNM